MRDLSFDYIKGVLIFLVVLGHVVTYIPYSTIADNWLFVFIYSFHMPLFVFISGYFFESEKYTEIKFLVLKKARRLLLPHLTYSFILLLIVFLFYPYFNHVIYDGNILSCFKIYHVVLTSLWFLWCVFLCSVITNLIFNYCPKPWLVCVVLCVFMLLFYDYMPYKVFKDLQLIIQMPFFLLGMYYKVNKNWINKQARLILLLTGLGYFIMYESSGDKSLFYQLARNFFSVPLFFMLIKQMYRYKVGIPVFFSWANVSLGIYIFHLLLMILTKNNLYHEFRIGIGIYGQGYWVSLGISVVICCLIYWLVVLLRKNGCLKIIFLGEK